MELENSKLDNPDSLEDTNSEISKYVKDLIEVMDMIDNEEIRLYIKEILLNAVRQRGLSVHFAGFLEGLDGSQENVKDLNQEEFKDQFLKGL